MDSEPSLEALEARFVAALAEKEAGRLDAAEEALRDVLQEEPRLPEPRLELAHLLLTTDRVEEAIEHARLALDGLKGGGQWVDDLPEEAVMGLAHRVLAEALRRRADEDDVIFGDAEVFRQMVAEAKEHFHLASRLDPSDEYSSYHAFFLGVPGARLDGLGPEEEAGPSEGQADDEDGLSGA